MSCILWVFWETIDHIIMAHCIYWRYFHVNIWMNIVSESWCRIGNKPLSKLAMTHFSNTKMSHLIKISLIKSTAQRYRKVSNIRRTKCQNLNVYRLVMQLFLFNTLKPGIKLGMEIWMEQRGLAGNAPTTSEWSTILLRTKVHLKLEVWR